MASNEPKYEKGEQVFLKEDKAGTNPYHVEGIGDNGIGNSYEKRWEVMIRDGAGKQLRVPPSAIRRPTKRENSASNGANAMQREVRPDNAQTASAASAASPNVPMSQVSSEAGRSDLPNPNPHSAEKSLPLTTTQTGQNIDPPQPTLYDAYKATKSVLRRINELPEIIGQSFVAALEHRDHEIEVRSQINDLIEQFSIRFGAKVGASSPVLADEDSPSQMALTNLELLETAVLDHSETQNIQIRALNRQIQNLQADVDALRAYQHRWELEKHELVAQCEHLKTQHTELEERFKGIEQQARSQRQAEQQNIGEGLVAFWEARENFYRGLHRGIGTEEGDERKRLKHRRGEFLRADIALMERLGCQMSMTQEALSFGRAPYDGSLHRWHEDREDPVPNGQDATVFLPGWRIGDTRVKPSFGSQEIAD